MSGRRTIFLGSKEFGLAILRVLMDCAPEVEWRVLHPDDTADDRSIIAEFRDFCAERAIPFTLVSSSADANDALVSAQVDLVFVCGWYFLLPSEVLASGPRFFGIHNSLLPRYRGGAPLVWAMINGEQQVGSTLFGFTPGMDDGPVFLQVATEPGIEDTIADVLAKLESAFLADLPKVWPRLVVGDDVGRAQDHSQATYCGQRTERDGRIDWTQSAGRVHNFIRAQSRPYPGAFSAIDGRIVRIWRTRPLDLTYHGTPGQILSRANDRVLVSCGDATCLEVLEAEDAPGTTDLRHLFPSLSLRFG